MIFITVGTTRFSFVRMERIFRDVCRIRKNSELVVFQHGLTPVATVEKNTVLIPYMNFDITNRSLRQARVVICHGGPATIFQALSYGKKPWVLPREQQYGEHVDDHQVFFIRFMETKKIIHKVHGPGGISLRSQDQQGKTISGKTRKNLIAYFSSL